MRSVILYGTTCDMECGSVMPIFGSELSGRDVDGLLELTRRNRPDG